jgi:hypothetical protein
VLSVGVEYYAALGPIDAPLAPKDQVHRLFAVANAGWGRIDLNLGAGYGLAAGDRWIVKAIVGFSL